MSELSELDLLECQMANTLQPSYAVNVSSPKKAKVDEEKQNCGITANTQDTKTFLVLEIGKRVCRFILNDGVDAFVINFPVLFVRVIFFLNL